MLVCESSRTAGAGAEAAAEAFVLALGKRIRSAILKLYSAIGFPNSFKRGCMPDNVSLRLLRLQLGLPK